MRDERAGQSKAPRGCRCSVLQLVITCGDRICQRALLNPFLTEAFGQSSCSGGHETHGS